MAAALIHLPALSAACAALLSEQCLCQRRGDVHEVLIERGICLSVKDKRGRVGKLSPAAREICLQLCLR